MLFRSRAKILVDCSVNNTRSRKEMKARLGQMAPVPGIMTSNTMEMPSHSDSVQDNLLSLHKSIESQLGIHGSASAIALAEGTFQHKSAANKRLKKESKLIVKKMGKKIRRLREMKAALNESQAFLEDATESGDEAYRKWKEYSLNDYKRIRLPGDSHPNAPGKVALGTPLSQEDEERQ